MRLQKKIESLKMTYYIIQLCTGWKREYKVIEQDFMMIRVEGGYVQVYLIQTFLVGSWLKVGIFCKKIIIQ